jgi:hypothetical protein
VPAAPAVAEAAENRAVLLMRLLRVVLGSRLAHPSLQLSVVLLLMQLLVVLADARYSLLLLRRPTQN